MTCRGSRPVRLLYSQVMMDRTESIVISDNKLIAPRIYGQFPNPSIFQLIYINHTMNQSYTAIERRIQEAIDTFSTRNNAKITDVAEKIQRTLLSPSEPPSRRTLALSSP